MEKHIFIMYTLQKELPRTLKMRFMATLTQLFIFKEKTMKKSIVTLAAVITATLLLGCSSNLSADFESETEGFENAETSKEELLELEDREPAFNYTVSEINTIDISPARRGSQSPSQQNNSNKGNSSSKRR